MKANIEILIRLFLLLVYGPADVVIWQIEKSNKI